MTCVDSPDYNQVVVNPGGGAISGGSAGAGAVNAWVGAPVPYTDALGNALVAWTVPPPLLAQGSAYTLQLQRPTGWLVYVPAAATTAHVSMVLGANGGGLTANQNYACLYSATVAANALSALTLVGQTAAGAAEAAWGAGATKQVTLAWTASISLSAGAAYYIALLANGTTGPQFAYYPTNGMVTYPPITTPYPTMWVSNTLVTTPPASPPLGTLSSQTSLAWLALS